MDDRQERIRRRAYELWEQAGKPGGSPDDFWLQAEEEVGGRKHDAGDAGAQSDIEKLDAERFEGSSQVDAKPGQAPEPDEAQRPDPMPNVGGGERAASQADAKSDR